MTDLLTAVIAAFCTLLAFNVGVRQGHRRGRREGIAYAKQIMGAAAEGYKIRQSEERDRG